MFLALTIAGVPEEARLAVLRDAGQALIDIRPQAAPIPGAQPSIPPPFSRV